MQVVQGQHVMEGAGVKICRTVGTSGLRNLDPFLMLDELRMPATQATAGFPDHPHRLALLLLLHTITLWDARHTPERNYNST
jgi:redox-sensitive bicupin YhaK (pirin superfamily)